MADSKRGSRGVVEFCEVRCSDYPCECMDKKNGKTARENESAGDLTVTVTADVGDAISGFKSLQRELRKTTQEARELERAINDFGNAKIVGNSVYLDGKKIGEAVAPDEIVEITCHDLNDVPTNELHGELAKRQGVEEFVVAPHGEYATLKTVDERLGTMEAKINGPARILVNKD